MGHYLRTIPFEIILKKFTFLDFSQLCIKFLCQFCLTFVKLICQINDDMKMTFLPIKIIIIIESTKLFKESVEIKKVHYFIQTAKFFWRS